MKRPTRPRVASILAFSAAITAVSSISVHAGKHSRTAPAFMIPSGRAITIDGKISPGEWNDAKPLEISIAEGWRVRVLAKHDAANFYFAFVNLTRRKEMRFPELLFDAQERRSESWRPGEWWLHSSFNLCEGDGEYNVYERADVFQCAKTKNGWVANHFPLKPREAMEIQVSFAKLKLKYHQGTLIGFAIDLTDTQKHWTLWPTGAQLAHPNTWGEALLQ